MQEGAISNTNVPVFDTYVSFGRDGGVWQVIFGWSRWERGAGDLIVIRSSPGGESL